MATAMAGPQALAAQAVLVEQVAPAEIQSTASLVKAASAASVAVAAAVAPGTALAALVVPVVLAVWLVPVVRAAHRLGSVPQALAVLEVMAVAVAVAVKHGRTWTPCRASLARAVPAVSAVSVALAAQ